MENGASVDTQAEGQTEEVSAKGGTGDAGASQGQASGDESAQGVAEGAEGKDENADEFGVGKEGDIPRARWDQFYAKHKDMESKLNEAVSFIESIRSDPDARREFLKVDGESGKEPGESEADKEPSAFEQFLAQTPALAQSPEHQSLFGNFGKAVAKDLQAHLEVNYPTKAELQKMIAPIMRYIGETETNGFYQKNPQAKAFESKIAQVMKQHPTLNIHQAFKLASDTDTKVRVAGEKKAHEAKDKLQKTPIAKNGTGSGTVKKPLPAGNQGIAEGVQRAFAKLGIQE